MATKKLVVCVCRGNILRSVVAEKLIQQHFINSGFADKYEVTSRSIQGTVVDTKQVRHPNLTCYTSVYLRVKSVLDKLNIDLTDHVSTPINLNTAKKATVILAMDSETKSSLKLLFPTMANKFYLFSDLVKSNNDILDIPYYTKPSYSVRVVKEIKKELEKGIHTLLKLLDKKE